MNTQQKEIERVRDALLVPAFTVREIIIRAWKLVLATGPLFAIATIAHFSGFVFLWLPSQLERWDIAAPPVVLVLLYLSPLFWTALVPISIMKLLLDFTRTGTVSHASIVSDWKAIVAAALAFIFYVLLVYLGTSCCLIPGLFFAVLFSQSYMLVLDGQSPILKSFKNSRRMIRGTGRQVFTVILAELLLWFGNQMMFHMVIPDFFLRSTGPDFDPSLLFLASALTQSIISSAALYIEVEMYQALLPRYLRLRDDFEKDEKEEQMSIDLDVYDKEEH